MNYPGCFSGKAHGNKRCLLLTLVLLLGLADGRLQAAPSSKKPATVLDANLSEVSLVAVEAKERDDALLKAAETGDLPAVKKLLKEGAHVDALNTDGWSPLIFAAQGGHAEVAHLLMEKGADVNRRSTTEIGSIPLSFATGGGSLELMADLVKHGADVNGQGRNGMTPLASAAGKGLIPPVEFLLANGAKINLPAVRTDSGESMTPLMVAATCNQEKMVVWLLEHGAVLDQAAERGTTALLASCKTNAPAVTKVLLQRGAKVDARGPGRHTGLLCACVNGLEETVKLLLAAGANPLLTCEDDFGGAPGNAWNHAVANGHSHLRPMIEAAMEKFPEEPPSDKSK